MSRTVGTSTDKTALPTTQHPQYEKRLVGKWSFTESDQVEVEGQHHRIRLERHRGIDITHRDENFNE
jgi:hypothetical protein